ncbi:hypothetical protein [Neobacillus drentensis]|uniref:hypothetical protein n=1 Tax=Neobacillus drentensis TaxID=220684 RepID=UPI0028626FBD|nr:hypothetical protein [Neobacillus drentensis]MDR7238726.1 hypothetical protein [Neobacillus drentensis]
MEWGVRIDSADLDEDSANFSNISAKLLFSAGMSNFNITPFLSYLFNKNPASKFGVRHHVKVSHGA